MRNALLLVVAALIAGCNGSDECSGKQVTCPKYEDAQLGQWIPYQQGQQLVFKSGTNDLDTIVLEHVETSTSYQDRVSGRSPNCTAYKRFTSNQATYAPFYSKLVINGYNYSDQFSGAVQKDFSLFVYSSGFYGKNFGDTGLVVNRESFSSNFKSTETLNGTTFSNVQRIQKDTLVYPVKQLTPYKVWIAKGQGLVAFEEFHGKLWVKQ